MNRLGKKSEYQIGQTVYLNLKPQGKHWDSCHGLIIGVITEVNFNYTHEMFYYSVKVSYSDGQQDTEKIITMLNEREINPHFYKIKNILLEHFLRNYEN
jgi:hypothetical protein